MKIVLFTHEFAPFRGGAATYVQEIATAAAAEGFPVEVWTADYRGRAEMRGAIAQDAEASPARFHVERFPSSGRLTPAGLAGSDVGTVAVAQTERPVRRYACGFAERGRTDGVDASLGARAVARRAGSPAFSTVRNCSGSGASHGGVGWQSAFTLASTASRWRRTTSKNSRQTAVCCRQEPTFAWLLALVPRR